MNTTFEIKRDRVRERTSEKLNQQIDDRIVENIERYSNADRPTVESRLDQIDQEWDIERSLELASATNALLGLVLGLTVNKKWFILTAATSLFLIQHTIQGWCPPVPVLRKAGVRTKEEIDIEREALLARIDELNRQGRE